MRGGKLWMGCALVVLGCAGETAGAGPSALAPDPREGTRRADVEAPVVLAPSAAAVDRARVELHTLEPGLGEDGQGHSVQAPAPVAIDLDARTFPPRALDPVLTIGQLRFTHYTHPRPGVLRFVIADAALLAGGEEIRVHHAADGSDSQLVVTIGEAELRAARQP